MSENETTGTEFVETATESETLPVESGADGETTGGESETAE